jgi:hypothetical protein
MPVEFIGLIAHLNLSEITKTHDAIAYGRGLIPLVRKAVAERDARGPVLESKAG